MDRRAFLKAIGIAGLAAVAPQLIVAEPGTYAAIDRSMAIEREAMLTWSRKGSHSMFMKSRSVGFTALSLAMLQEHFETLTYGSSHPTLIVMEPTLWGRTVDMFPLNDRWYNYGRDLMNVRFSGADMCADPTVTRGMFFINEDYPFDPRMNEFVEVADVRT